MHDTNAALMGDDMVRQGSGTFRVSSRAYTENAVLKMEQKNIFEQKWCFVAHESEITSPGDFRTGHIGMQPIIVTRGAEGQISVLLNRCVHRGAAVCRETRGNARSFVCPYHAWNYAMDGKLVGISGRNDAGGYAPDFEEPEGLFRLPRVESYRGFIFASFNPDVPPLTEALGRVTTIIDRKLNQSPLGTISIHARPYVGNYEGNWKFHAENIIDGYHFMYTHQAFVKLQSKFGDSTGDFGVHKGGTPSEMRRNRNRGHVWGCSAGHIVNQKPAINTQELLEGPFADFYRAINERYGEEEFGWIFGSNAACIFPNFGLIHNQIRTWRPIAPNLTEVRIYLYDLDGAPEEFNAGMLRSQERFYGPSGYGMPDDIEMFAVNQQGMEANSLEWLILERGMHAETPLGDGDIEGMPSSESGHRAFWREWSRSMNAGAQAR